MRIIETIIEKIYNGMGSVSEGVSKVSRWLIIPMIGIMVYETTARYVFGAPTRWVYDMGSMLLAVFIALGFAYVYFQNGNIRVDIFYAKFSPKTKLIVDIVFTIFIFFPLFFMLSETFIIDAWRAFTIGETRPMGIWHPLAWPYRFVFAFAISLLLLQGIATFLKDVMTLVKMTLAKGGKEP